MKYLLTFALVATMITGMAQKKTNTIGIDLKNLDKNIKPGKDFFTFANGGWQKANPIGDEYATFGAFNQLDNLNNERIRTIIEEIASKNNTAGSIEDNIAKIYNTLIDMDTRNKQGLQPLDNYIKQINKTENKAELMKYVATMMLYDINTFFSIGVESDAKDSKANLVQLMQGGITLGEMEYYLDTDEHTMQIRNAYRDFGTKVFKMLNTALSESEAKEKMNTVIRLETRLASSFKNNTQLRVAEDNYNKISFSQLQKDYPEINWSDLFFNHSKFPSFSEINVGQPYAIETACKMIAEESLEDLKTYMTFRMAASTFSLLGEEQKTLNFDFFGRTLQGRQTQQPLWKQGVEMTNSLLGEAVGQIYVKKYFPESSKKRMLQLVENLRVALGERIEAQEWMSNETKDKAKEKLSTFYVKIGYPDKWQDYSKLNLNNSTSLLDVALTTRAFNNHTAIEETVGKPVDKDKWYMTPQTVNAYYNPPTNEICFPAGILQYPFFDENADDAFNYGAIGVVIGHEMTHGFDDQGRKYDKDGNMSDWWSETDQAGFNKRAQVIVDFFSNIKVLPDLNANGALTQGENLADHGGLQVAYTALQNAMKKTPLKTQQGFTPNQRFFLAYAGVWANNIREAEMRRRTKSDVHSLAKWRVNGALPHIDAWYDAFGITEKDSLFVPKANRVTIW